MRLANSMRTWDDDDLQYGYVLERLADGKWWHLHIGRMAIEYDCELLGRKTNLLFSIQLFSSGCVLQSSTFLLTLDGEGIERLPAGVDLGYYWGRDTQDEDLIAEAKHFQAEVMPLLHASEAMQHAVAEIIYRRRHLRLVTPDKLLET